MFVVKHKLSSTQEYCVFTRDFKQLSSRVFFALTDKLFNRSVTFRETHFIFSPVLFSTSLLNYAGRGRRDNFFDICTITNNFNQSYIFIYHIYVIYTLCIASMVNGHKVSRDSTLFRRSFRYYVTRNNHDTAHQNSTV